MINPLRSTTTINSHYDREVSFFDEADLIPNKVQEEDVGKFLDLFDDLLSDEDEEDEEDVQNKADNENDTPQKACKYTYTY
jgi:hypothetical protein